MARGMIYEISTNKEELGNMRASDFYEGLYYIADWVEDVHEYPSDFIEWLGSYGAKTGRDNENRLDYHPWFILTDEVKENIFKARFRKVKEMVENMDLHEFATSDLFTLRHEIMDDYADAVSNGSAYPTPLDTWIRDAETDVKYYVGNIVFMH